MPSPCKCLKLISYAAGNQESGVSGQPALRHYLLAKAANCTAITQACRKARPVSRSDLVRANLQQGQVLLFCSQSARHWPQKLCPQGAKECAETIQSRHMTHSRSFSSLPTRSALEAVVGAASLEGVLLAGGPLRSTAGAAAACARPH